LVAQWIGPSIRFPPYEIFACSEAVFGNEFWGVQVEFVPTTRHGSLQVVLTSIGPYSGFRDPIKLLRFSTAVPEASTPVNLESKVYENYVGQYRKVLLFGLIRVGPTLNISHRTDEVGDHLIASVRGYGTDEVFPTAENAFILSPDSSNDLRLTFVQTKKRRTKGVRIYWNGKKLSGARISKQPAEG
jgi:hypothetical protein